MGPEIEGSTTTAFPLWTHTHTILSCKTAIGWIVNSLSLSIIVYFGTALTFTILSKSNEIVGVNIVPGLQTAINSLYKTTAKLPKIDIKLPDKVIGKNTIHSIQSGIMFGYVGLIKEMIIKIKGELSGSTKVVATGGLSKFAKPLAGVFNDIIPTLTLDGMLKILDNY